MFKSFDNNNNNVDGEDGKGISFEDAKYLWCMITTLKTTFTFKEFEGKDLSTEERRQSMIKKMNKLDQMLPFFDLNHDGKIDAEEFVKIMTPF